MIPVATALLALLTLQAQADTVWLAAEDAFPMALEAAPTLEASRRRTLAAEASVRQARAWTNPVLSITAENLGATFPTTGIRGAEGVEGQAVIVTTLPVGGDLAAARSGAEARLAEARSVETGTEADLRMSVVEAVARANRDEQRLARAIEEATGLEVLADALAAQADLGRTPAGEAARAHLAMVTAHTVAAEAAAQAAASGEELTLLLGLDPGTPVRIEIPVCTAAVPRPLPGARPAEIDAASARREAAAAEIDLQRALRIPDVAPQVGVRRAAGVSALYLGVSMPLPFFDRRGAAVESARAEEAAAAAELDRIERSVAARQESARRALAALEAAGTRYTDEWSDALDRAVLSAEARYRLGEGSLTELLDGRRARLQALDGYERWRADLFMQRAHLARLTGAPIDASLLCGAAPAQNTHIPEARK